MTSMISLLVGISSSLIATFLFIMSSELVRKVLLPWYGDKIYRGSRVDGVWEIIIDPQKPSNVMQLEIKQRGDRLSGIYWHRIDNEKDVYILEGRIRDALVMFTAVPKSNRHVDAMSGLFRVMSKGGNFSLEGLIIHQGNPDVMARPTDVFTWRSGNS